jgi:uncharacterized protein YjeT (DUF2065 family)
MWAEVAAGILIVSGLAVAVKPERLRRRIKKKGVRTLRWYLASVTWSVAALLISIGWQHEGVYLKLLACAGVLLILKGVYFVKAKSVALIAERLMAVPALYLRIFGAAQVALGMLVLALLVR